MKHSVLIVAMLSMSVAASAHEMSAAIFSDTAPIPVVRVQAPGGDDDFQYVLAETIAPDSGLTYDEYVRIAVLLVLVQLGIVTAVRDAARAKSQ